MSKLLVVVALSFFLLSSALADGTVFETTFYSQALGKEKCVQVYLPECYDASSGHRFPVIYFLHGALEGYNGYSYIHGILDELIGSGVICPVIMIKPDGFSSPYPASFYTSSILYGDLQTYISEDLVNWVDSNFRTLPNRPKRAIMGHSMGGYGALVYCGLYPDIYCAGASCCGSGVDFEVMLDVCVPLVLGELTGPPYIYNPMAGFFNAVLFSCAGAFSPNLANPPWYVDLPLDSNGDVIPEVFAQWMLHDAAYLMADIATGYQPNLYMDVGTYDEFFAYPQHVSFVAALDDLGIDYEYQVFEGGHFDKLTERFPIAIEFLCSAMSPSQAPWNTVGLSGSHLLSHSACPTPFSKETIISFELVEPSHVTLAVFDMSGRVVTTLLDENLGSGRHSAEFTANSMPSGVYLYVIESEGELHTGTCLLVR